MRAPPSIFHAPVLLVIASVAVLSHCRDDPATTPADSQLAPPVTKEPRRSSVPPLQDAPPFIAIIDSGIDRDHPAFENAFAPFHPLKDALPGHYAPTSGGQLVGWDVVTDSADPSDRSGHGTHVAGIVVNELGLAGANAPSIRLLIMRSGNQTHSLEHLTTSVLALTELKRAGLVIPIVMIPVEYYPDPTKAAQFAQWEAALSGLLDGQTLCIAAAGNRGRNNDLAGDSNHCYPSDFTLPDLLSVACTNESGHLSPISNTGAVSVDLGAPGFGIEAAWLDGKLKKSTGTSQSCAYVAARAAKLWPELRSPAAVKAALLKASRPHPSLIGKVNSNGYLQRTPNVPN